MSSTTPILGAPQVAPNQNNKEQTINDAVLYLENATQATARWDASAGPVEITNAQLAQGFFHVVYGNPTDTTFTVPAQSRSFAVRARGDGATTVFVAGGSVGYRIESQTTQWLSVDTEDLRVVPITVDTSTSQGGLVTKFRQLQDVPAEYTGKGGYAVKVRADATGLEFVAPGAGPRFIDLSDVPPSYAGQAGKFIRISSNETNLEYVTPPTGAKNFRELLDVPATYGGRAGQLVRVKSDETGLEFTTAASGVKLADLADGPGPRGTAKQVIQVKPDGTALEYVSLKLTDLADGIADYSNAGGKSLRIKADGSGTEYSFPAFAQLSDGPGAFVGKAGQLVRVKSDESGIEYFTAAAGVTTFRGLSDTPGSYLSHAGKIVQVKTGEDGLQFTSFNSLLPTQTGQTGKVLITDGTAATWQKIDPFPSQGGNSGKTLTTDGTNPSWTQLVAVQAGQAGKFLTTDGTTTAWATPPGPVDIATFIAGKPAIGETLMRYAAVRTITIPASFAGSIAAAGSQAGQQIVFSILKNGAAVGTLTFAAGSATGTFSTAGFALASGDILSIVSPGSQDQTLADISITLTGTR